MRQALLIALSVMGVNAQANVIQYFTGISYSNPAELMKVSKNTLIIGTTGFTTTGRFQGSVLNFNTGTYGQGVAFTRTASALPYGRIAVRQNAKWVLGVDITQPFHSNLNWGNQSFSRYAATQTYLTDVDVSPRFAYSISPQLKLGAGINVNFLKNNETNWAVPISPSSAANLINSTAGFGVGFDLGAFYALNQRNFLGITYYSKINQPTRGRSVLLDNVTHDVSFNFTMPATMIGTYVHLFNPSWLLNAQVFYSEWRVNQYARFWNTAAPGPLSRDFNFKMNFRNSMASLLAIRNQYTEKLGLTAIGVIDKGPERPETRSLNFPSDTQYFLAISADYKVSAHACLELLYGYGFLNTKLNNHIQMNSTIIPFTTGHVDIHANVLDLKLRVQA